MTFGTDVKYLHQMSLLSFQRSRSTFKVICFENDPPATAMTKRKHPKVGYVNLSRSPGASKGILGDAKCVTEIIGGQKWGSWGTKSLSFTFLFHFKISAFNRLQKSLGDRNKMLGGQHSSSWAFQVPLPFQYRVDFLLCKDDTALQNSCLSCTQEWQYGLWLKSVGLIQRSAATWRCSVSITWTR